MVCKGGAACEHVGTWRVQAWLLFLAEMCSCLHSVREAAQGKGLQLGAGQRKCKPRRPEMPGAAEGRVLSPDIQAISQITHLTSCL